MGQSLKIVSTCGQFGSRKTNVVLLFSFKLNTDAFIKPIYYNICMLTSLKKSQISLFGMKGQL